MHNVYDILVPTPLAKQVLQCRELRTKYETNRLLPLFDTYLLLKHYAGQPGIIKNALFATSFCKITDATMRKRIGQLVDLGWVQHQPSAPGDLNIKINSWKELYNYFNLNYKNEFTTISYNTATSERLQDRIWTIDFEANKLEQHNAWFKKLNRNHEDKSILVGAMLKAGADKFKLDTNHAYFINQMQKLYIEDFKFGSSVRDVLMDYRPFFERGIRKMQEVYCFKSKQSVSYRKNVLKKRGVIKIEKEKITSTIRGRNKHCCVLWNDKTMETTLVMPDAITILKPQIQLHNEAQRHSA